jgi:two-component system response regulator FixJ
MQAPVVVIDGDVVSRDRWTGLLQSSAHSAVGFETADAFFVRKSPECPACCVVEAPLLDMTGPQFQAECRRRGMRAPTLFLVSAGQVELAVALVRSGATDVMTSPPDADELRRRVHQLLARVADARGQLEARGVGERLAHLTHRELEVVRHATRGLSNKDIAEQLHISFRTVEVHRHNALRKTGTNNIVELTHLVTSAALTDDLRPLETPDDGSPEDQLLLFPKHDLLRGGERPPRARKSLP